MGFAALHPSYGLRAADYREAVTPHPFALRYRSALTPSPSRGEGSANALRPSYRENFLYLILCGMTLSVPSRRILSFS